MIQKYRGRPRKVVSPSQPVDYIAQTRVLPWSLRCNLTEKKNKLLENFWGGPAAALTVSQNIIPQQDYNFIVAHIFTRIISTLIFKGPLATKTSLQTNKEPALSSMVNVSVLIRNLCIVFTCYVSWVDSSLEYQQLSPGNACSVPADYERFQQHKTGFL